MEQEWEQRRAAILKDYDVITKKILDINNLSGARLKPLRGGYVNLVLLATKSNTKRVIKISVDDSLQDEVYWYAKANAVGVSAPKLFAYDLSKKSIPFKYDIVSYINGKPPNWKSKKLLYRAGFFAGKAIRKVHKTRVGGYGCIEPNGRWSNKTWIEAFRDQRRFTINDKVAQRVLKPKQIELIDNLTIYNRELEFRGARLLHGDLYEDNILYSRKLNRFFIIDPSYVIAGDPMYDVSYSMVERSKGFDDGVKDGYGIDTLTEKELYRLKMLSIFQIFKEMTEYIQNKDSKEKISKLHKLLLNRLSSI